MKHGLSDTRLYGIYSGMKQRCYNPKNSHYQWYGGKGIAICDEWMNDNGLQNFISWSLNNGYNEDLTIDRIDSDKGYIPDNCRWVTLSVNSMLAQQNPSFQLSDSTNMTMEQKINMAAAYKSMIQAALARSIGMTPSNFNQKLKRDTFSTQEMEQIATALGGSWRAEFEFPDGTRI